MQMTFEGKPTGLKAGDIIRYVPDACAVSINRRGAHGTLINLRFNEDDKVMISMHDAISKRTFFWIVSFLATTHGLLSFPVPGKPHVYELRAPEKPARAKRKS